MAVGEIHHVANRDHVARRQYVCLGATSAQHDLVVVLCSEGYTSSLAAASLQDLGLTRATDLVGGLTARAEAGLPVVPG